jgi:hypothetical protein
MEVPKQGAPTWCPIFNRMGWEEAAMLAEYARLVDCGGEEAL